MQIHSNWQGVVEDVRRALAPKGRAQLGQFVAEGARLIERAVRAGKAPHRVVISRRQLRHGDERTNALLAELEALKCEVYAVPEAVALELAEGRNGGLIFGLCAMPEGPNLQQLCELAVRQGGVLLVMVEVEEPGNVGALVRSALASGAVGAIAVGSSDPYHPKAVRTSMGSLFKLPIARAAEVEQVLAHLEPSLCVAAVSAGGESPWSSELARAQGIFVGREAEGLPEALVEKLGLRVSIPMPEGVDSFSVNAAAAILLYETMRQNSQLV